jgi:hypothetical protein
LAAGGALGRDSAFAAGGALGPCGPVEGKGIAGLPGTRAAGPGTGRADARG